MRQTGPSGDLAAAERTFGTPETAKDPDLGSGTEDVVERIGPGHGNIGFHFGNYFFHRPSGPSPATEPARRLWGRQAGGQPGSGHGAGD